MASSAPATPASQVTTATPRTDSPGTWKHPRFEEIVKRRNSTVFSARHLRRAIWNTVALAVTFFIDQYFYDLFGYFGSFARTATALVIWLIRGLFLYNLYRALTPLFTRIDNLTDIPLTPQQRFLLGLDPKIESPATPGSDYITPPKYRLSATSPQNHTPQSGRSFSSPYSSSPLSGRGPSPTPFRTASRDASTFSPSGSPLYHKVIGQDKEGGNRRLTYGTPSPTSLGRSLSLKDSGSSSSLQKRGTSTPSPNGGGQSRALNGGVNYKWLYERGAQASNRRESIFA